MGGRKAANKIVNHVGDVVPGKEKRVLRKWNVVRKEPLKLADVTDELLWVAARLNIDARRPSEV